MLIKLFRIELLKIRRSLALLMLLACPLMVVVLVFGVGLRQTDAADFSEKTWFAIWQTSSAIWCYFMLPLYIALITGLLNGNEHKNQTWRLMLSLPISSRQLYFAKAMLAWAFVIGANLLLATYISLVALTLGLLGYPMQGAFEFPIWYAVASISLACLPVLIIQHAISWRFSNIVFPLATGVIATMGIVQLGSSEYWIYYPWSYILMAVNGSAPEMQQQALLLAAGLGTVLFVMSSYWIGKREVA